MIKLNEETENVLKYLIDLDVKTSDKKLRFYENQYTFDKIKEYSEFVEHLKMLDKFSYVKMFWADPKQSRYKYRIDIQLLPEAYAYFNKEPKLKKIGKMVQTGATIASTITKFIP